MKLYLAMVDSQLAIFLPQCSAHLCQPLSCTNAPLPQVPMLVGEPPPQTVLEMGLGQGSLPSPNALLPPSRL